MLSFKEEQETKNKVLLQKRSERDATKNCRRRARGPGEEDQIDEYLPQPNTAYSTSMQEIPVLQSGVHPSNRIRQIIKKRQIVRQMDKPQSWALTRDQNHASNEVQSGVHPSNRIRQRIKKRQIVRQIDKPQEWAQCGGSIPRDQNHASNEVQIINQVETNVERHRRLVQEDICRVLEQQVERQSSNLPQYQEGDGYFPTARQQENT
jgi:ribosomal protein S16